MQAFLVLDTLFQGGRNLFGAIFVPYLISKGVNLADVATLKLLQSSLMLIFEFPTGFIADHWGRRLSLVLSTLTGAVTFWCFYVAQSYFDFAIAEVLLALTLSFWSGAFDAYAIESLDLENSRPRLHQFFHLRSTYVSFGVMTAGFLGGLISTQSLNAPYLFSILVFLMLTIWIQITFPQEKTLSCRSSNPKLVAFFQSARSAAKTLTQKHLVGLTLSFIVLEIITQPLFFYWQAWFMNDGSVNTISLGLNYALFQLGLIVGGLLFAKLSKYSWAQGTRFYSGGLFGFSVLNIALIFAQGLPLRSLFLFVGIEILFSVGSSALKAELNAELANKDRASYLSFVSMLAKAGGMGALFLIHTYLKNQVEPSSLARVFGAAGLIGTIWFLLNYTFNQRQNHRHR